MRAALVIMAASACGSSARTPEGLREPATYAEATEVLYRIDPSGSVSRGQHEYDGVLQDITPAALAEEQRLISATLARLESTGVESEVLRAELLGQKFSLEDLDVYRTNPMTYMGAINLDAYISRDYAPAEQRAAAVIKLCRGVPAYLAQARKNLVLPLPRTFIDTALLQTNGLADFADKDVRAAFTLTNRADLDAALATCTQALREHATWLTAQQATATTKYALGAERFAKMLAVTQGVTVDLPRLREIAEQDLQRNLAALDTAARAIDPKKTTREVVDAQALVRPNPQTVLAVATEQTAAMRAFVVAHAIATIPTDNVAVVKETPPFARWNSASLDTPGPFETAKLQAFYYISPPDPTWPEAEQLAYLPPTADLMFTTIHEVWPGHFLQRQHINQHPSRALRSFCTYSNVEGWAHYTEEMMFDAGAGDRSPASRIGMLKEALLRNVRFVAALGLHTGTMTVEEATKLFAEKGFVDPGNARQQAVRGTFDPMYLSYTLGKLMIRKLGADWLAAHAGSTLQQFHDTFLSYGCAPIPTIRRAMLGASSGAAI